MTNANAPGDDMRPVVPNDDPGLYTFLNQIAETPGDRHLVAVLADWLADRDDPRAVLVRDLAAPGEYPGPPQAGSLGWRRMIDAQFWIACHRRDRVHAAVKPDTALHRAITAATRGDGRAWPEHRPATVVNVDVRSNERTAGGILGVLDTCRTRLLLAMFGTTPTKLGHLRVVKTSGDLGEVKDLLYGRQRADTIPWLTDLYKSDPRRFAAVLTALLEVPHLRPLGCEVMDVVAPGWPARFAPQVTDRV